MLTGRSLERRPDKTTEEEKNQRRLDWAELMLMLMCELSGRMTLQLLKMFKEVRNMQMSELTYQMKPAFHPGNCRQPKEEQADFSQTEVKESSHLWSRCWAHRQAGSTSGSGHSLLLLLCCASLNCLEVVESRWEITHESIPLDLLLPLSNEQEQREALTSHLTGQKCSISNICLEDICILTLTRGKRWHGQKSSMSNVGRKPQTNTHGWGQSSGVTPKNEETHHLWNLEEDAVFSASRDTCVIFTCCGAEEGRGIEPSSFRCLFVSFASWLVACWICCLWTQQWETSLIATVHTAEI